MTDAPTWKWEFLGFESRAEGQVVQDWFDSLPETHREEIVSLLAYLQNMVGRLWDRPYFDPLEGEGGTSEIIVPDIRDEHGVAYYRIYGFRGPKEHQYTFLHSTNKKARNDKNGKRIARRRFDEVRRGEAGVHKFSFE
ncbi:MAG: hypothetical protein ACRD5W_04390 [Candidatus Acidiferrales bacterium]